jgi:hypothetical protein
MVGFWTTVSERGIGSDEDGPWLPGGVTAMPASTGRPAGAASVGRWWPRGDDAAGELMVTGAGDAGSDAARAKPLSRRVPARHRSRGQAVWLIDPPAAGPGASSGCSRGEPESGRVVTRTRLLSSSRQWGSPAHEARQ